MTRTLREIRKSAARERRELVVPASSLSVELRSADGEDGGVLKFTGHAAVFEIITDIAGYFTETIKRGAFRKALADEQDTVFNWDHQSRWPLARISAGNLSLSEDTTGLAVEAEIPLALSYAKDLKVLLDARIITGMSFAFTILTDEWTERTVDGVYQIHRDVIEIDDLYDVCVTVCPATPETDAEGRTVDFRALEVDEDTAARIAALNLDEVAEPEGEESEQREDAQADETPEGEVVSDDVTGGELLFSAASRRIRVLELSLPPAD